MNFNSLAYLFFLPAALALYYSQPVKTRKWVLLGLSYFFYMNWSPSYALLILASTVVTYFCGRLVCDRSAHKKLWVALSLIFNLGLLIFFKYFYLIYDTASAAISLFGISLPDAALTILLPVGISFYTFQALGYTIDVYRGDIECERDFAAYALFVSFFVQLVAGPIERSSNLLPQLKCEREFSWDFMRSGGTLILWGVFKKLVIADNLAPVVNTVYGAPADYSGLQLIIATAAFAILIYCDFSAYTDIARGSAALLGIKLMRNFDAPYLAVSVRDFWRRWHISLSSWFRDYLYFPLGGSRRGRLRTFVNIMIVFAVSGLWHGAAGHFLLWGLLNGAFQIIGELTLPWRKKLRRLMRIRENGRLATVISIICTFFFICVTWVFFRADTVGDGIFIIKRVILWAAHLFTDGFGFAGLSALGMNLRTAIMLLCAVGVLLASDVLSQRTDITRALAAKTELRYAVWFALLCASVLFGAYGSGFSPSEFVYFQF